MSLTKLLVVPVFLQVALTFGLLMWLGLARAAALRQGRAQLKDIALSQSAWPDDVIQISNAHNNQYQLPILFFVLVLLALDLRMVDTVLVGGAWLFVLSRLAHAYIHVTSNIVPARFLAFAVGVTALAAMWVWLAAGLLSERV